MTQRSTRPNVLFIMADQFRPDFMGSAGASFVRTPNLDRIAASGVRFSQCFTNCPICAPARIGLASGMQPGRLGSLGNNSFLPATRATYYQRLRDHNYRVGCVGKLDLAKPESWNGRDGDRPCNFTYGFTHPIECEGKMHAGKSPEPSGPYGLWLASRGLYDKFHQDYAVRSKAGWVRGVSHDSVLPADAFEDTYIGRRAVGWIDNIGDDFPWHLFVSFAGPHDPFDPPTCYADKYRMAAMPEPIRDSLEGKPLWQHKRTLKLTDEEITQTRRQYCASIEAVDDAVGAIVAAVTRRGQADNTYIIFSSDHGEMLGDHDMYTKALAYESSLHVPLLAAGPGIAAARVSDALVELIDVGATICDLAGVGVAENIDARSFRPILRGQAASHRSEVVSEIQNWRCIRTDRYKLVQNSNDLSELYDLQEDPQELHNIAAQRSDLAGPLRSRMSERFLEGGWRR